MDRLEGIAAEYRRRRRREDAIFVVCSLIAVGFSVAAFLLLTISRPLAEYIYWSGVVLFVCVSVWRLRFSLKRAMEFAEESWQRATNGYAYVEAWNLCHYLARYALPRLKHIREHGRCIHFGNNAEESKRIMDDIIYALELDVRSFFDSVSDKEREEMHDPNGRYARGLALFGQYWTDMWD